MTLGTGYAAGLSGQAQIRVALYQIIMRGGEAVMADLYDAVDTVMHLRGFTLSEQGRASLRFFVNTVAVRDGFVYPHDRLRPGWRITPEGLACVIA